MFGGAAASAFAIFHGTGNGILTIARGTLPLAIFGPQNYGYRLGIIGAPARMAQAAAPLAFGLLVETMGSNVLIVSSALSLSALLALLLLRKQPAHRPSAVATFAASNPARFRAEPPHGKSDQTGYGHRKRGAMGDHPAAILCGIPGRAFPGGGVVVLCRQPEAEARRRRRSCPCRAAQLFATAASVHRTYLRRRFRCALLLMPF